MVELLKGDHFIRDRVPTDRKHDDVQPARQRVRIQVHSTLAVEEARERDIQVGLLEIINSRHSLWYVSVFFFFTRRGRNGG
jgi:hypothetical protein